MSQALLSASPNRLSRPRSVASQQIHWKYAIAVGVVHLLAFLATVPWFFSWAGVALWALGVPLYGQGINLVYHRLLSHRSFQVPRWLERMMVVGAMGSMQDAPARWVAVHRLHHVHTDEQEDPHSPLVALLWSHIGWLLVVNREVERRAFREKYARDILEDPFYRRLDASALLRLSLYLAHTAVYFVGGAAWVLAAGGSWLVAEQFGWSLLVWGVFLRTVTVWHITWSVNSLTHLFGYRNYETGENSRNNWLIGLLAAGEGWHNNHHHDPASASVQHHWWELDPTFYIIKLLQWTGLATDVVPPRHRRGLHRTERSARSAGADLQRAN